MATVARLDDGAVNFNVTSTFLKLASQSRYLDAESLYRKHEPDLPSFFKNNEHIVSQVLSRADETRRTLHDVEAESSSTEWSLGTTYLGITTHYKMSEDNLLSVKLEGILDNVPLFDQANVIYEIDLFTQWMPLCSASVKVDQVNKSELVAYLRYKPPLGRDTLLHVYASDCLLPHDKVVIVGKSVESWPPPPATATTTDAASGASPAAATDPSPSSGQSCATDAKSATMPNESTLVEDTFLNQVTSGSQITYHNTYGIYAYDNIQYDPTEQTLSATVPTTTTDKESHAQSDDSDDPLDPDVDEETPSLGVSDGTNTTGVHVAHPEQPFQARPVPWLLNSWFNKKMEILDYRAVFTVLSPHKIQTNFVICVDPKTPIPRALLNFFIRNVAGLFLYCFQNQVLKVGKSAECAYTQRIAQDPGFYRHWLLPKLRRYYRKKGWPLDESVLRRLGLTE